MLPEALLQRLGGGLGTDSADHLASFPGLSTYRKEATDHALAEPTINHKPSGAVAEGLIQSTSSQLVSS